MSGSGNDYDQDVDPIIVTNNTSYICSDINNNNANYECPYTCVGLSDCTACGCAIPYSTTGPWGKAMDVIMCLLPIIFLVIATIPPCGLKPLSTTKSLPTSALLMYLVRLMYLGSDPLLVSGSVIKGIYEAITPLTIMAGAIMLFETMEATRCLPYMMREIKALTGGHHVAELSIIYSFAMMVEGASGFGTPVALGAPMLISLGHPKFESVVVLLLFNTFATVFGAAGTPIWYGFGSLGLSQRDFVEIGFYSAVALVVCAYLLLPLIFATIVSTKEVKGNLLFIILGISSAMLPMLGISYVSYEFPSLISGIIGLGVTAILIQFNVGLKPISHDEESIHELGRHPLDIAPYSNRSVVHQSSVFMPKREIGLTAEESLVTSTNNDQVVDEEHVPLTRSSEVVNESITDYSLLPDSQNEMGQSNLPNSSGIETLTESQKAIELAIGPRKDGWAYVKEFLLRTSPITGTVLLLIITRIPQIGLNELLKATTPNFSIYFGTYAIFRLSASLVFQLEEILTYPTLHWKYELLYTPFIIPFVLMSVITYIIYRKEASDTLSGIFRTVFQRVKSPAIALAGALTLVQLMITGEDTSPAAIIGIVLSDALKGGWIVIAASIGALGSFFSGSTTVSNLTFGSVQQIAAETIGTNVNAMLALQVVGASAGNGVCLNNIISACTVTSLAVGEGKIIAKTAKYVGLFLVLATLIMLGFLFS